MKFLTLAGAMVMTVILLIIAFQNISVPSSIYIFFGSFSLPLTVPILAITLFGMIAGAFYTLFVQAVMRENDLNSEENQQADDTF